MKCPEPDHAYPDDGGDEGDWETCWYCHGEGGWHDCGEDCCPCPYPRINVVCPECRGRGSYEVPR